MGLRMPPTTTTRTHTTHVCPLPTYVCLLATPAPGYAADLVAKPGDALGAAHTQPRCPRGTTGHPHAIVDNHPTFAPPRVVIPAAASGDALPATHTPHPGPHPGVDHHPTFVPHRVGIPAAKPGDVIEWWKCANSANQNVVNIFYLNCSL